MLNLHEAIKAKDNTKAKYLLQSGVDIDISDEKGLYPLHLAVLHGLTDIVHQLLKIGANPNITMNTDNHDEQFPKLNNSTELDDSLMEEILSGIRQLGNHTPIHIAVKESNLEMCQILLEFGANVNATDLGQCTPLHWAALNGDINITKLLLQHGADANVKDLAYSTPLHEAIRREHDELVLILLLANADPNQQDIGHMNAYDYAKHQPAILKVLLECQSLQSHKLIS